MGTAGYEGGKKLKQIPDRMISAADVRKAVEAGELVEDYPEDTRGHSCLILGFAVDGTPVHVVCSPKGDYLAIITAYLPNLEGWEASFKKKKKS
jgi:hypothetical protein